VPAPHPHAPAPDQEAEVKTESRYFATAGEALSAVTLATATL
jgi:hypothetical protein